MSLHCICCITTLLTWDLSAYVFNEISRQLVGASVHWDVEIIILAIFSL